MSEALVSEIQTPPKQAEIGAIWFLKRAIMAVVILSVSIGGIAWLLHASIDPTLEANAAEKAVTESVVPN